jgi:N-sulfoglucosamine sulfohydrolase
VDRRSFLKKSGLAVSSFTLGAGMCKGASWESKRPNIVFWMSDDQSWLHTSIGGDAAVKTADFDRVAREGILFTNSFTACRSCAAFRASILTGQSFWRLEEGGLLFGRLRKKFSIYTKLLEDAGYVVCQTGKGYASKR